MSNEIIEQMLDERDTRIAELEEENKKLRKRVEELEYELMSIEGIEANETWW